ncbi:MAG: glycosyl hydrolase family 76 [Rikenellaceae bacterium]|nr:glycosyl hydrolase family 76 [Rikenellaceae bacterium]
MKKFFFYFICAILTVGMVACSSSDEEDVVIDETPEEEVEVDEELEYWKKEANNSTIAFVNHFWNKDKKFFNSFAGRADTWEQDWCYWPQAHAMDVLIDAYVRSGNKSWLNYFDAWYVGVRQKTNWVSFIQEDKNCNYDNDFVDDMEWICLTMIRLYEHTSDKKYINTATELWRIIKRNWNEEYSGGGIAWKQSQPDSKNSCSNGPAGIIAARMYKLNGKKKEDLDWAKKIYEWQTAKLVDTSNGKVYDHIANHQTGERKDWIFTYNQGTYMGMAHELYTITGEQRYLDMANKAATYCITNLIDKDNNILKDEGTGDGGLFKAVFVRYFVKLVLEKNLAVGDRNRYTLFFNNNAKVLNEYGTGSDYHYGPHWSKPGNKSYDLNTQTSACTMIEAKAYYEMHKPKK